jgi:predicted metal-dependent RNase
MDILKEVLEHMPSDAEIASCSFEGANIIVYTKSKEFFLTGGRAVKDVVNVIKKRVELRPDPSIALDMEKAKAVIEKILPKEANVSDMIFDAQRSQVIIEAEKPGIAIGKAGELLKEIKRQALWVPLII